MAQNAKAKNPRQRKGANGYVLMSTPVPMGETLQDLAKERWVIGPPIGQGGFGVIYSANKENDKKGSYPYVIKFEPHGNGPLFVERNFYLKAAQKADIDSWIKSHKLQYLGLPRYWGSGSHEVNKERYRFLVTDKFGTDLWTIFNQNKRKFPLVTVLRVALQTLDVLEYIHSTGYVHGDVKAANLVLGLDKNTQNKVFLIDFGLVTKATTNPKFTPDPKMAHNGTIEYLSEDAHQGVPTMRGDLEVLAFNMLHWLASALPWDKDVANTNAKLRVQAVQASKHKFMQDVAKGLAELKLDAPSKDILTKVLSYVRTVEHNRPPDYSKVRDMLLKALKGCGASDSGPLKFSSSAAVKESPKKTPRSKAHKRKSDDEVEEVVSPRRTPAKPRQTKAKAKYNDSSDDDSSEDDFQQNGAKPRRGGKAARACSPESSSYSSEEAENSPTPPKRKKKGRSAAAPSVPLWKQSQTAQASGVERAGEYTRQNPVKKSTQRKKD